MNDSITYSMRQWSVKHKSKPKGRKGLRSLFCFNTVGYTLDSPSRMTGGSFR